MARKKDPWGKLVLVDFDDGIAWVTLNRPDKRNAMSPKLNAEMRDTVEALATDERCGVLVLTGAGDSFAAGMDLKEYFRETDGKPDMMLEGAPHGRGVAVAAAARLPEGHDRHGQRLVLRRRVHADGRVRSRDRGRRGDVRPVRGQLGHHPGRQRHESDVRDDRAAQRALLRDDGRTVQRQEGSRDGPRQRIRAAQEAQEAHDRSRADAARRRTKPCCAASRSR